VGDEGLDYKFSSAVAEETRSPPLGIFLARKICLRSSSPYASQAVGLLIAHTNKKTAILVGEGAWPRTFFVAVAPKNFSALLVRPIVLDGYPALVFKSLIALQNQKAVKR